MRLQLTYHRDQFKIFCAIILIVVLMFLSNYYIFYNSTQAIYQQARDNNILTVKSMIKSFDECFKDINNLIHSLYAIPHNIFESNNEENFNYENAFLFLRETSKMALQDYIADFIIFSDKSAIAVSSEGTGKFDDLINTKYKSKKYAPEYWKNFAATRHPQEFVPTEEYTGIKSGSQTYTRQYFAIIGSNLFSNSKYNVIIFIDSQKLLEHINSQNMMTGASFVVMDSDGRVLISTDNSYGDYARGSIYPEGSENSGLNEGNFEYSYTKSGYNSCTYISKMPRSYEDIMMMLNVNRIIFIITVIVSVVLAFFLSIYLYKPVKNIISLIGNRKLSFKNGSYNEIYKNIEDIKKENISIKSQLDYMEEDVRRSIFFKLVDDISSFSKLKNQIDKYFKVIFSSKKFVMVAFHFNYTDIKGKHTNKQAAQSLPDDLSMIIQDKLSTRFDSSIVFFVENMLFIALIGLNGSMERNDIIENITSVAAELEDADSGISAVAAISRFYTRIEECKNALKDIKMCLAYRNIRETRKVIDAENPDFSCEIFLPPEHVEILLNLILKGDRRESIELINNIIDTNITKNISHIKFNSIISNIFNNIINIMGAYGFERPEVLRLERQFYEILDEDGSYEKIKKFLCSIIEQITEKVNLKNQSKLNKDFILEYIHLHYNEDLYLEKMADITGTTAKYFSNYFKKMFGINFVEYLNKERINHAKALLKKTDIPVYEIGERVGFPLSGTFTKTFKKYCGVSPAEYRKSQC